MTSEPSKTRARAVTFALTWVSYASYYLTRKHLSVTKVRLENVFGFGKAELALIETPYLVAYAAGQFLWGMLTDRVGARRILVGGMLATAALSVFFGMSSALGLFVLAFGLNGLAQSSGWPANVKAMAGPFSALERPRVMGFWCTCYQVGGLLATTLATFVLVRFGWRAAFWAPAIWVAAVAVAIGLWLPPPPRPQASLPAAGTAGPPAATIASVLKSPRVWRMGACYFCLKLIRYSLLFWFAYYLQRVLHYSERDAGYFSTSFEVGGIAGTIATGLLVQRLPARWRGAVAGAMILGLAGAIGLYAWLGALGKAINFLGMALVGFLLFGPDALVSAVIAQDAGGRSASGTAAGVINGVGSVGAFLEGVVTAGVTARWGWNALFGVFIALALLASLMLAPEWRRKEAAA